MQEARGAAGLGSGNARKFRLGYPHLCVSCVFVSVCARVCTHAVHAECTPFCLRSLHLCVSTCMCVWVGGAACVDTVCHFGICEIYIVYI